MDLLCFILRSSQATKVAATETQEWLSRFMTCIGWIESNRNTLQKNSWMNRTPVLLKILPPHPQNKFSPSSEEKHEFLHNYWTNFYDPGVDLERLSCAEMTHIKSNESGA